MSEVFWRRLESGAYQCYTTTPKIPTEKERARHKKSYKSLTDSGTAYCIMCEIDYDLPSAFSSIRKHGICQFCKAFNEGLIQAVRMWRLPTFEEAVSADEKRHYDAIVILKSHKELEKRIKDLELKQAVK